jgi:hypothetical protein
MSKSRIQHTSHSLHTDKRGTRSPRLLTLSPSLSKSSKIATRSSFERFNVADGMLIVLGGF